MKTAEQIMELAELRVQSLALFHEIRAVRIIAAPPLTPAQCRRLEAIIAGRTRSPQVEQMFVEGLRDKTFISDPLAIVSSFFMAATASVIGRTFDLDVRHVAATMQMTMQRADGTEIVLIPPLNIEK